MNLSRADIARLTGASPSAVQRWECGESKPGSVDLAFYARSMAVSVAELLAGSEAWTRAFEMMSKAQVFERHKAGVSKPLAEIDPDLDPPRPLTPEEIRARKLEAIREAERRREEFLEVTRTRRGSGSGARARGPIARAAFRPTPCRTVAGCPIGKGWCTICERDVDVELELRLGRNLLWLAALRAQEQAEDD